MTIDISTSAWQTMLSMRRDGRTIGRIADTMREDFKLDISDSAVFGFVREIPTPNQLNRQRVRDLAKSGASLAECAKFASISVTTAQRWCKGLGLKKGPKL